MEIDLGIGQRVQTLEIENDNILNILYPNAVEKNDLSPETIILNAIRKPIGKKQLSEIIQGGEKIVIVTSDNTRPMPSSTVLPVLLSEIELCGVKKEDITIIFALGSHRKLLPEEMRQLVGSDIYDKVKCENSGENGYSYIGKTSHGTPIEIDNIVLEADKRICLGNIEYHYFAGYSGGAKAIMPGVSTYNAIQVNHKLMIDSSSVAGNIDSNPVRKDFEEAAEKVGIDFILNVVLDEHKHIVAAFAGDMILAHRVGCRYLDKMYEKGISSKADIVVVSQGGAPKDINLYQAQKALDNAKYAVKNGGIIILVASCKEGFGNEIFKQWFYEAESPKDIISRLNSGFVLGGHKAVAIAKVLQQAKIYLVSDLNQEEVEKIFMTPFKDVNSAYQTAIKELGINAKTIIMPYGGSTLPKICY